MTNENNKLIEENINLAYKVAIIYKKKFGNFMELEELQSLCFLGLTKAANTYDYSKNIAFSTYAYTIMKNEIMYFWKKNKNNYTISLSTNTTENLTLQDNIADTFNLEDIVQKNILIDKLYEFISDFNDTDKNIILLYLKGLTIKQIAINLNVPKNEVYTRYKKILNILRFKFSKYQGGDL